MAKTYLYLTTLCHRTKNISKCVHYYEKYNKIVKVVYLFKIKLHKESESLVQESDRVLEGLKLAHDEYKKKQHNYKNMDQKKLYDEICLKHITKLLTVKLFLINS